MPQPSGFVNEQFPTHVCKLEKVIYGLTLASWYLKLSGFLQCKGFHGSNFDASMMLYNNNGDNFIFYLYK